MLAAALAAAPARADVIQITDASLTGPVINWYRTNIYVLNGYCFVKQGSSLNIEAGTIIKGKDGAPGVFGALFVTRGAKIFANGTPAQPIVFTAEADNIGTTNAYPNLTLYQRGLWGGIVLYGNAVLNTPSDAGGAAASPKYDVFEGLPDTVINGQNVHRFGGNDDNDSSGVMRYVSIRHGGKVLESNKELNGLSMCAVGRGTTIEFVETYAIADDGFEFFGGTVNTRYLVSAFNDDDAFDTDQGHRGQHQFWFGIQAPDVRDKGFELNGEPNGIAVNASPIANFTVYNATMIGAGVGSGGANNNVFTIREYAAPRFYNCIFTDFAQRGISIDSKSLTYLTNGTLEFRENIWFGFTAGNTVANLDILNSAVLFTNAAFNNLITDPLLMGISRTNNGGLDPRPQTGSLALLSSITAPDNGFLTPAAFKGAFDQNNLWIAGWTALSQLGVIPQRAPANVVQVSDASFTAAGSIINWYRTNVYVLNGYCFVKAGQTLNIEAGTIIKGKDGAPGVFGALFITRGAKIFANGTANNPIVFTAEADSIGTTNAWPNLGVYQRGLWGGLVIYGRATLNTPSDAGGAAASPKYDVFEGLADTVINGQFVQRFGGNDDNDNSGVLRYVSIRHGGKVLESNKELNGLSLCAVGRGTTIEFVEAFAIADDGFEWFGGTVNTRYLVSAFNDDDAFDADQGYRGRNQFWFGIHAPDVRDKGFELNGEPNGIAVNASPVSNFEVYNATSIGAGVGSGGANNNVFTIREYSAPKFYNSIFTDYAQRGISIDSKSLTHLNSGLLKFENNLWFGFTAGNTVANLDILNSAVLFTDTTRSNLIVDPLLTGISRTNNRALDPRPQAVSVARGFAKSFAADGFLTPVTYAGAFGDQNWAADWTALSAYGVLTTAGGGTPGAATLGVVPPTLAQAVSVIGYSATRSLRELQGTSLTLLATPAGSAPFTFQWFLNGAAVLNATNSTYTITSLQSSNSGNYTIVIGNAAGVVSNTVPLAISAAPDTFTGFVNQGMVGVGRLSSESFDKLGVNVDTLGGVFSGMYFDPGSWVRTGAPGNYTYGGKLYGMPDRGFGDGAQDYHPRIQVFDISVTPYYGSTPVGQNQITISNSATLLLTDGTGAFFTGFDATDSSATNFPRSAAASLGAGKRSLDPEGIHRMRDGGYFISDEYGASVYRFSAAGVLLGTLPVPAALVPQNNGTNSYLAAVNPLSGRRPNRGFEGVSVSPDERRLFVVLQSPTIQDGGASNLSQHTRVLVYDIEAGSPTANQLIGEYVYQLTLRGDATFTRNTPLSEVVALNDHQLLVLERDGIGLGGTAGTPLYKSINLVELNGATNILGTGYDLPLGAPGQLTLPLSGDSFAITTNVFAATVRDFVNIIDTTQLAKFGLNASTNRDANSISEKWEGVTLIPMNEPGAPNDYIMLVGNDNDFKSSIVYHNGVSVGTNAVTVDTFLFAYRVTLPGAQVSTAPVIATQPASGNANAGGNLALSTGVLGAGPITFQWFKNGTPVPGATNARLQLSNLIGDRGTNHLGPSTMVPPVMDSLLPGYTFQALFSVGETVNLKADGVTPYRMVGIPDGLGAMDNGNGTFTLFMNHELNSTVGTNRTHGGKGAFVSRWVIAKSNLAVLNISDLMTNVFLWTTNGNTYTNATNAAFGRFCSADLPPPSAFFNAATGLGTTNRIYMNGEEIGKEGRAVGHIVTGPDNGKSYELPYLGKISWENSVPSPFQQNKTIVMCNDDSGATDSRVHVYIGTKSAAGLDIDKAGLTGGTLYGIKLTGFTNESNASVPTNGTVFSLFSFGNVSALTGAQLEAQAVANGVATFQRTEDGAWDPKNPRDFYFVTTASFTGNSRLWRLRFADIANPENGGTIDLLMTGSEGHKMFDNVGFDADGNLLLQEDPGNQAYLARMWKYVPSTGASFPIATFRTNLFTTGQPGFLTIDEEASGVIDVTSILGYKASLLVAQIHTTNGVPVGANTTEIVENGQLLLLREVDSGGYTLVVSNAFGAVTSAVANVTISAPPAIGDTAFRSVLPGATVGNGGTLNLAVPAGSVSGTGPFTYQWFLNGALIVNATNSTLTVPGFNASFAGNYTVQIGNPGGTVTSVNVPVSTADIAFFGGVTVDGPANARYRLEYLNDVANTNSWLTLTNIVHPGGRQFYIDTSSDGRVRRFFRAVPLP
jgi:hypothetical protein